MPYIDSVTRPARTLTDKEQRSLLEVTGQHRAGYRDHMLFALALATGLREHELVGLDMGDVYGPTDKAKQRLRLRVYKRSNADAQLQEAMLGPVIRAKLDKFRAWKAAVGQDVGPKAPLFVSQRGTRLACRSVRYVFGLWQKRARFESPFNFHALRHTACSNLYRQTKDLRLTQRFARHKSPVSTARYTHGSDEDMAAAVALLRC